MLTFQDIFKSDFLSSVDSISLVDIALALVLSFALGLFIFFVYKRTYMGVMYSSSFGVTLVALTMITTVVILAVTSNVVLSLGMVGALSIVRFRAAIKEPLEIAFLFWAIAVGIVLAAGLIVLAVIGSAVIGLILIVFVNRRSWLDPYIVVLRCDGAESEREAADFLKERHPLLRQEQDRPARLRRAERRGAHEGREHRFHKRPRRPARRTERRTRQLQRRVHGLRYVLCQPAAIWTASALRPWRSPYS